MPLSRVSKIAAIVVLVVVVVVGLPLVVLAVAPMAYSGAIERYVRSETGIELTFRDLDVTLVPLQIGLAGLVLHTPDPAFEEPLLVADHLHFHIHAGRYLGDAPNWWRGSGRGIRVRFEEDARGRTNWDVLEDEEEEPVRANPLLQFDAADIEGMTLLFVLEDERHRFDVLRADLAKDARERLVVDLRGRYQDEPFEAVGALVLPHPELANEVAFRASGLGGEVTVEGVLGHDGVAPGEVRFDVVFDDLAPLSVLLDQDLRGLGPLILDGRVVASEPGRWRVEAAGEFGGEPLDLTTALTAREPLYVLHNLEFEYGATALQAQGEMDWQAQRLQGTISATRLHLTELITLLERLVLDEPLAEDDELPSLHEVVEGLPLNVMEAWTIDLGIGVEQLEYQAVRARGLDLDLARRGPAIQFAIELEEFLVADVRGGAAIGDDEADDGQPWGLVEPLRAEGTLTAAEDDGLPGLTMRVATAGVEMELDSRLPLTADDRLDLTLRGSMTSAAAVQGVDLNALEPWLPLEADLDASRQDAVWRVEPLDLALAGQRVSGRLLVDRSERPLRIRGDLRSPQIDLIRWLDRDDGEPATEDGDGLIAEGERLLPDHPIDWSWLEAADVNVGARVERVLLRLVTVRDLRLLVRMRDGELLVDPVDADLVGGTLRGHLRARRQDHGADLGMQLIATGLAPADLGLEDEEIQGGETDLFVDLRAGGRSPRELGSSLHGELAIDVRESVIDNEWINVLGGDAVWELVRFLNPFADEEPRTYVHCAAAHAVARDGVLYSDDHVVIETDQVIVRASGVVDLREESLEIEFESEATEDFDIGIADVADLVRVSGSLTDPDIEPDPEGIAEALLELGAAIATVGASAVVQGLFANDNGTPCRAIFAAQPADHEHDEGENGEGENGEAG